MTARPESSLQGHRARGFSLIETLLSMLVVALAALALGQFAGELRAGIDLSRQRAAALRASQADLEAARAFTALHGGSASWSAIGSESAAATWSDGVTDYVLERRMGAAGGGRA